MLFMPLTLVALSKVEDRDAGLASSLLNTGQQVGGAIGLAVLGTVAWTVVANSIHSQVDRRGRGRGQERGTRCTPPAGGSPGPSTTTRWRSGSPAGSWSPPGSR